jgi:hypothetical protein
MKLSNIGKDDDTTRIGEAVVSCLWRICCSLCCWRYAMRRWGRRAIVIRKNITALQWRKLDSEKRSVAGQSEIQCQPNRCCWSVYNEVRH